jgi:serine/threonine protein kinase
MSERFVRCEHCGQHHDARVGPCPLAGRGMHTKPPRPPLPSQQVSDSVTTAPMARRDLVGTIVGEKYVVRAILGEGGMGTVYEAEHMTIGRAVAVKVLHPKQMRKKESVRRFHHEARAAGAIGHPNICEVYDLGTLDDGRPYLVMEKLVGKTLADRVKEEGGLPFEDVIDILTQVLSGLVAAHGKGILHRDIKPENVFLTERVGCAPVAKLLDFGVSKATSPLRSAIDGDDEMDLTRTGMVMGTPYYMSPEQARGDRDLDVRVDMYACGVICYEAVTGRRPFLANNYNALLLQILSTKPRPARELRPDLPAAFARLIEKAMARKRDDRYQNATEFQRDLQRLRAPAPSSRSGVPSSGMKRVSDALSRPRPIVELPSDALLTPSSVEVPAVAPAPSAMPRSRARGFDDAPTDVALSDFSLPDEDDAATTLMRKEDIAQIQSTRRPAQPSGTKRDEIPIFNANDTDVTKTAVKKPSRGLSPDPYDADETARTDRAQAAKGPLPAPRRAPKR